MRQVEKDGIAALPPASSHLTVCGVPGIGRIPWGIHFCHFYRQPNDLPDSLVPYFTCGLHNRERCVWVTEEAFPAADATAALAIAFPDIGEVIAGGALRIVDSEQWYGTGRDDRRRDPLTRWLREEERALMDGYRGLRIAGAAGIVDDWAVLIRYEAAVSEAFQSRHIVALCAYNEQQCVTEQRDEMISIHHCTLDRRDERWQVLF